MSRTRPSTSSAPAALPVRYLTPADLADILRIPVQTLYQWRTLGTGPPGFRIGRHLRYDPVAVRRWIDQRADDSGQAA